MYYLYIVLILLKIIFELHIQLFYIVDEIIKKKKNGITFINFAAKGI